MQSDIRIGKIFGVEIFISYSWFFIFGLVTFSLAFGLFPAEFPTHSSGSNMIIALFASALFFASLLFHEMSHSLVANLNNIPIKKITLFIFGGMSHMSEEPKAPGAELKMALAGPASSFVLAGAFYLIFRLMAGAGLRSEYFAAFSWLAQINLFLAIFNLAPGFPLDGGRVVRAVVWRISGNFERATNVAARAGQGVAFVLIGFGVLLFLAGELGGLWLVMIGWFLNQSAAGSFRQVMIERTLADVTVADIMSHEVKTVGPKTTLADLVDHYFLRHRFGRFPVLEGEDLRGIVTLHDVKDIARERWPVVTVGEIIEPLTEAEQITPGEPAVQALKQMAKEDIGHLLVFDESRLVGLVTKTDIIALIRIRGELGA